MNSNNNCFSTNGGRLYYKSSSYPSIPLQHAYFYHQYPTSMHHSPFHSPQQQHFQQQQIQLRQQFQLQQQQQQQQIIIQEPIFPKFPPQNFDIPDINFSNSVFGDNMSITANNNSNLTNHNSSPSSSPSPTTTNHHNNKLSSPHLLSSYACLPPIHQDPRLQHSPTDPSYSAQLRPYPSNFWLPQVVPPTSTASSPVSQNDDNSTNFEANGGGGGGGGMVAGAGGAAFPGSKTAQQSTFYMSLEGRCECSMQLFASSRSECLPACRGEGEGALEVEPSISQHKLNNKKMIRITSIIITSIAIITTIIARNPAN
ncbi:hypothetical protein HELRODRAFT_165130 [Helobdella robusta]|uniref:Uncharacterized protein n=1 Tax=Helobdella robusta TaxID=6412 RepID=T1EWB4_HELRO|nr:hypothetical protein HELRODRAFT_165130 [Helobdella robusta]ESN92983.1 hypothetical protein HELRODRAFT_165130 [Helobdella robusta]